MFPIPNLISSKIALVVGAIFLTTIAIMGINIWWLRGELEDTKEELRNTKAAYILVTERLNEQNDAVIKLGDKKKEAEVKAAKAAEKAKKLKAELDKLKDKIDGFTPDPNLTACENAAGLIGAFKK